MPKEEQCYPCSAHGQGCELHGTWKPLPVQQRRVEVPVLPYSNVESTCRWFDVALWMVIPECSVPAYVGYVEAVNAFPAVEQMMRYYRLRHVVYASVRSLDGVIVYRAYHVRIHA